MPDPSAMARALLAGDTLALARALSLVERQGEAGEILLAELFPRTGQAHIIGITGAPGTGKSSLLRALAAHTAAQESRTAILAVDPTSALSGGALLGDRVRMTDLDTEAQVYIRSLGTRGSPGSLGTAAWDAVLVLDAAGYDPIFVETVGAGQNDIDIHALAHTTVLIEAPGQGDMIQALKAGLLEVSDIAVVNKQDRPGCHQTAAHIRQALVLGQDPVPPEKAGDIWSVPVLTTNALSGEGVGPLWDQICAHARFLHRTGRRQTLEWQRQCHRVDALVARVWQETLAARLPAVRRERLLADVVARRRDPYAAARELLASLLLVPPEDGDAPDVL